MGLRQGSPSGRGVLLGASHRARTGHAWALIQTGSAPDTLQAPACEQNLSPPNPRFLWSFLAASGGEATTVPSAWWSALSTPLKCPGRVQRTRNGLNILVLAPAFEAALERDGRQLARMVQEPQGTCLSGGKDPNLSTVGGTSWS